MSDTTQPNRKVLNLRLGEPAFLKGYWEENYKSIDMLHFDQGLEYNHGNSDSHFVEAVTRIHSTVGNAITEGKQIIAGAGIRQLMIAALYAQAKITGRKVVYADPPHFFLFKQMTELLGLEFVNEPGTLNNETMINIITSPSNPLGMHHGEVSEVNIWDLCYNWPQYGEVRCFDNDDVQIFGLAKATGHPGVRIGWALVKDATVAMYMREYLHISSGGCSEIAQLFAADVLNHESDNWSHNRRRTVFFEGQKIHDRRWDTFHRSGHMSPDDKPATHPSGIEITNICGMFGWAKLDPAVHGELSADNNAAKVMYEKFGVEVLPGELCYPGAYEMCRINLCCDGADFAEFVRRIS